MNTLPVFVTIAGRRNLDEVRLMIASLRTFGGVLAQSLVWVYSKDPGICIGLEDEHTRCFPLVVEDPLTSNLFGSKVTACAQAEKLTCSGYDTLVWIDPSLLVVQPPELLMLGNDFDAAFRPVHIRNVGLSPSEPLDAFWRGVCTVVGVADISSVITSFVDAQVLRSYFNSHCFAVNPEIGMMGRWCRLFESLLANEKFQSEACADELHQIFLFQALLSTLVATMVEPARLHMLPPSYNYPFNLQERVPADRRASALNEVITFTYEDRSINPDEISGIEVKEPLRSWLETRFSQD
jgi:hypothetical protein